jgi:glycosyltransferase involved in cell wall biosynthesis
VRIAVNAAFNPTGGAITQLINMVYYISNSDNEYNLTIYVNNKTLKILEDNDSLSNYKIVLCKFPGISILFRVIWEQLILPLHLINDSIDVLFCPGNIAPIFSSSKKVVWIGTIGPFFKDFYKGFDFSSRIKLFGNKLIMILSARKSDSIIFESMFTKKLFIKKYGINPIKSAVINIGKDKYFFPAPNNKYFCWDGIKYESPYILCVSHLYPYKNIIRMLDAFFIALKSTKKGIKLLIAGNRDYKYYDKLILQKIDDLSLNDHVKLLGPVSKEGLRELYSNCSFIIFPSPFENFSYTLVEAMSCGSPIISSNTTAMPETCGDAALYFNPYNTKELGDKISLLLTNKKLRRTMSIKSILRANELPDYEQATIKTLDIMKNLVNE